jgi:hypothetical protein
MYTIAWGYGFVKGMVYGPYALYGVGAIAVHDYGVWSPERKVCTMSEKRIHVLAQQRVQQWASRRFPKQQQVWLAYRLAKSNEAYAATGKHPYLRN